VVVCGRDMGGAGCVCVLRNIEGGEGGEDGDGWLCYEGK
jgi:hypothetical protein